MYQYISNKLVFAKTQVLDSLLMFLILAYILTIPEKDQVQISQLTMRFGSL